MANTSVQPFDKAYINDPRIIAERNLNNSYISGTMTLPIYGSNSNGGEEIKIVAIPFHLENNFSFALGNNWKTLGEQPGAEFINQMINMWSVSGIVGSGQAQVNMQSRIMQMATWGGSITPTFKVDTTFVCTRRDYNPVHIITALSRTCLPERLDKVPNNESAKNVRTAGATGARFIGGIFSGGLQKVGDLTGRQAVQDAASISNKGVESLATIIEHSGLVAPLRYAPIVDEEQDSVSVNENQTVTLQIGNWFFAPKLLVKNIGNIEFSKEIIAPPNTWAYGYEESDAGYSVFNSIVNEGKQYEPDDQNPTAPRYLEWGFPLYVKCSLELQPITLITIDEFLQYFPQCPRLNRNTLGKIRRVTEEKKKITNTTQYMPTSDMNYPITSSSELQNNTLNPKPQIRGK